MRRILVNFSSAEISLDTFFIPELIKILDFEINSRILEFPQKQSFKEILDFGIPKGSRALVASNKVSCSHRERTGKRMVVGKTWKVFIPL
jgi:hypothetical protein